MSIATLSVLFSVVSSYHQTRGGAIACGLVDCVVHCTTPGGAGHIDYNVPSAQVLHGRPEELEHSR